MTISDSLREAVEATLAAGTTRYQIAKTAGLDHSALTRFVQNGRDIRISTADKLASALDLQLAPKRAGRECKE